MKFFEKIKNSLLAAKRTIITVCAIVLVISIVVTVMFAAVSISSSVEGSLFGKSEYTPNSTGEFLKDERAPQGMNLICENNSLAVFYNEDESAMSILDKNSGAFWNTLPDNIGEDTVATGVLKDKMRSALEIKYYNSEDAAATLNTYKYCVQTDTLKYEFIENGLRIIYQLGDEKVTRTMLPAVVDKNKFEEKILSKLSDAEKAVVQQYYKLQSLKSMTSTVTVTAFKEMYTQISESKEYYFLDNYTPEYKLKPLYQSIYGTAKYTAEDVKEDNKKVGYNVTVESFLCFVIPVEYTLSDDSFVVSIPASQIEVPSGIYLTEISVLPFFGSAGKEDEGYMFVPDGSGALIDFNNGRKTSYPYTIPIYGKDGAIREDEASFNTAYAKIPVFGMVYKNSKAMLAIIEQGESHATINAQISGVENEQNYTYVTFNLLPMDIEKVSDAKFNVSSNLYQEEKYNGRFTIRYSFLGSNNADYSSLAVAYREYLRKKGVLTQKNNLEPQLALSLTGKVEKETSFIGIPYKTTQAVTTFDQAKEIVAALNKNGVSNINVGFNSWLGGGIKNSPVTGKVSLSSGLGGKKDLKALKDAVGADGEISLGADLLTVYSGFPEFNQFNNAVRFLNNEIATGHFYDLATWQPSNRENDFYYLSPRYINSVITDYKKSVNKLNVSGLWLNDVGNVLTSDFKPQKNIDREETKRLIAETLADVSKDNVLTAKNPDLYIWQYIESAVNFPTTSSENVLVNESVPFLQIVLSGSMNYSGKAFNRNGNTDENFLKAVETGSDIYYDWIYMPDVKVSGLKGIETEKLYSKCYSGWIDTAVTQYNRIKNELDLVVGKEILGHKKITENVYKTEYDNASVIVNYNFDDVEIDDVLIKARDFKVLKGESK